MLPSVPHIGYLCPAEQTSPKNVLDDNVSSSYSDVMWNNVFNYSWMQMVLRLASGTQHRGHVDCLLRLQKGKEKLEIVIVSIFCCQ